jgi:hypothetical protein
MHGTDPHDEIDYWRERAEAKADELTAALAEITRLRQLAIEASSSVTNGLVARSAMSHDQRRELRASIGPIRESI